MARRVDGRWLRTGQKVEGLLEQFMEFIGYREGFSEVVTGSSSACDACAMAEPAVHTSSLRVSQ
jgi:hypothetical protein